MTCMNQEAMVLKSDKAGRVQTPVELQIARVREYERSGLSGPRFAAMAGVRYQTFVTWRRKHGVARSARGRPESGPVPFMEAVIAQRLSEAAESELAQELIIELSSGVKLRLQCASQIPLAVQLLKAMQESRPC